MKRISTLFYVFGASLLTVSPVLHAQSAYSVSKSSNVLFRPINPPPGDGGGGVGGGGGGTPPPNYTLNWSTPYTDPNFGGSSGGTNRSIGGTQDRVGVGVSIFNNLMYISYTGGTCHTVNTPTNPPSSPSYPPYCQPQTGGGGQIGYSTASDQNPNQELVASPGGAVLKSNENTSVATFNGQLYYAGTDTSGNVFWLHSADGVNWGNDEHYCMSGGGSGPSLAVYHNYLYLAVNNSNQLAICRIDAQDNATIFYPSTVPFNMDPGLGVYNDTLYVGFQPTDNSHSIILYTSTDGANFSLNMGASGDQTSTTPSLVTHKGVLYLGFRTNDGDHKFLYKYSLDGSNFTSNIDPHYTMGGPPHLIEYSGILYNWFSQNDTGQLLYSSIAQ